MRLLSLGLLSGVLGLVACGGAMTDDDVGDAAVADSATTDGRSDTAPADSWVSDSSAPDSAVDSSVDTSVDTSTDAPGAFCGGIAGKRCPDGYFCSMDVGACRMPDAGGTCKAIPTGCTKELNLVCGCDGKEYSNPCMAEKAGTSVARFGSCSSTGKSCGGKLGGICPSTEWCDYPSTGVACGAADGTGLCQLRPSACPTIYAPVCGCDGKTYGNACEAHAGGTDDASKGECPK